MKAYLDTNVLIAASVPDHQHHAPSFDLVLAAKQGRLHACISTHGLAEFYSVITRVPLVPRVHPAEANRFLEDNVIPHFDLIALTGADYKSVLRSSSSAGVTGGRVFDALHLRCAEKAACEVIYTFNTKDFRSLAPPRLSAKISAP